MAGCKEANVVDGEIGGKRQIGLSGRQIARAYQSLADPESPLARGSSRRWPVGDWSTALAWRELIGW